MEPLRYIWISLAFTVCFVGFYVYTISTQNILSGDVIKNPTKSDQTGSKAVKYSITDSVNTSGQHEVPVELSDNLAQLTQRHVDAALAQLTPEKLIKGLDLTPDKIVAAMGLTPKSIIDAIGLTPEKLIDVLELTPEKLLNSMTHETVPSTSKVTAKKIVNLLRLTPEKIVELVGITRESLNEAIGLNAQNILNTTHNVDYNESSVHKDVDPVGDKAPGTIDKNQFMNESISGTQQNLSSWKPPELPSHLRNVDQFHPELIQHIRQRWLIPPPGLATRVVPAWVHEAVGQGRDLSESGQVAAMDEILGHRHNGFFLECGAADGVLTTNTLWLELKRNWTGLLIEANPIYFNQLRNVKRNVYLLNACLSPSTKPEVLKFTVDAEGGGISDLVPPGQQRRRQSQAKPHIEIQCFPLYSVLAAVGLPHIDYFSLDVEGAEVNILRTIPFDKVSIDSFTIEKRVVNDTIATRQKSTDIMTILSEYSYTFVKFIGLDIVVSRTTTNGTGHDQKQRS